jgi:catechol 2,3-dioxygenase-like lactoylglutathione lyase family enzyme
LKLSHLALTCSSEEKADRFYAGLLGLKKSDSAFLHKEISSAIFGLDAGVKKIYYSGESMLLEIFIYKRFDYKSRLFDHICFKVEDLEGFLDKCCQSAVEIIRIPKGDYLVTFIKDFDGNLFEIKGQ